jgi:hypothetical protein
MPYYIAEIRLRGIAEYLSVIEKIYSEEYRTRRTVNQEKNNFVHSKGKGRFEREEKARGNYGLLLNEAISTLKEKLDLVRLNKKKVEVTPKKEVWAVFGSTTPIEAVEIYGRGRLIANSIEELQKLLRKRGNIDLYVT